jgi:hypothetical protein
MSRSGRGRRNKSRPSRSGRGGVSVQDLLRNLEQVYRDDPRRIREINDMTRKIRKGR